MDQIPVLFVYLFRKQIALVWSIHTHLSEKCVNVHVPFKTKYNQSFSNSNHMDFVFKLNQMSLIFLNYSSKSTVTVLYLYGATWL